MELREYQLLGENIHRHRLENGLEILVDVRPEYAKQFAFFATRYGGMHLRFHNEDGHWVDTPAGVAHFLEHKMFDSEEGNVLQIMAANGAVDNAFTAAAITGYYFECTRGFEENLRTLLSFVTTPYFTQESVAKEQGIIAQEIRMCLDDPDVEVYYQLMEAMYQNHPVRVRVAGSEASIAQITPEVLYRCHEAFYRPDNMVLCVAGSVDPQRVMELAREIVTHTGGGVGQADLGQKEPVQVAQAYVQREMPVSVPVFELGVKGTPAPVGQELRQQLVGELVCDVLFGASAPLYTKLYEEGLINSSFGGDYESVPGCAYLMAGGESRDPKAVRDAVLAEAQRLCREGLDPELWDRLKKAAYGSMVRRLNSLEDTCMELAQNYFRGEEYLNFPQCFQSIEWADARAMLEQWCVPERVALSVVCPVGTGDQERWD